VIANQAIGIRHSQKTLPIVEITGSVFSYVDSIRIHIDRSAIGFVFPISVVMARTEPFDAAIIPCIGSPRYQHFQKRMGLRLGALLPFGRNTTHSCCRPHFPRYRQNIVGMLFRVASMVQRCASWNLQASPARTESQPTLYLACPSQIADATSGRPSACVKFVMRHSAES